MIQTIHTTSADQLAQGLATLGINLPAAAQQKLLDYAALLAKWNKTFSLTALRAEDKSVSHHLLDSLAILPHVPAGTLLDVGSGGGMPGIPLAIACPELRITLIDSNSKKTAFLKQAAIELSLSGLGVHCGRVEKFSLADGLNGFDAITSRAFSDLVVFVGLTRHLLRAGGCWLAMKGQRPDTEIGKLPAEVVVEAVHRLDVPGIDAERHLVVLRRVD